MSGSFQFQVAPKDLEDPGFVAMQAAGVQCQPVIQSLLTFLLSPHPRLS